MQRTGYKRARRREEDSKSGADRRRSLRCAGCRLEYLRVPPGDPQKRDTLRYNGLHNAERYGNDRRDREDGGERAVGGRPE
jgi:hypothetical protein